MFGGHELDVRSHTEEEQRNILFTKDNPRLDLYHSCVWGQ